MQDRIKRQTHLLRLLKRKNFGRQEDVVAEMLANGFCVTQSSISRDFRDLGIIKAGGRYVPMNRNGSDNGGLSIGDFITHVDTAGQNLLVVKTHPGASNIVGWSLDAQQIDGLVGTVAGDDTLFVATKDGKAQKRVLAFLDEATVV